ncbi:trypsin [Cochliomyia hominivorax]
MKVACLIVFLAAVASASPSGLTQTLRNRIIPRPPVGVSPFIIGGENAAEKSAPYLVSLSISSIAYAHSCAGAIIGKEWVLSAAHCVQELKELSGDILGLPVYAGLTNRNNLTEAQVRTIDFAFNHKKFTGLEGSEDIALLHVTPSFEFNAKVQQIALPYKNEVYHGEVSANYGWGLDDPEGVLYVNELQVAKSDVLSHKECKESLPGDAPVTTKQICVKVTACYGDGGSPLVVERPGNVSELIGITSFGYLPCGYNNRPTIYTAVSQYVDWIAEVQWAYYVLH